MCTVLSPRGDERFIVWFRRFAAVGLVCALLAVSAGQVSAGANGDTGGPAWTVFDPSQPPAGQPGAYRYGPAMIINADGSLDMWTCSPGIATGPADNNWDYIRYRHSSDGGHTWGSESVTIAPTVGSPDTKSTCDPGVVRFNGYYYLGYTSTAESSGSSNHVFMARSENPNGPWQKWNGTGWGGSPQPVVSYTGLYGYYGAGEPSMVVGPNNMLYLYYSWWSIDGSSKRINQTRVQTVSTSNPNWPAALTSPAIAIHRSLDGCDSTDHKYVPSISKFIAIETCKRFTADAFLQLWESDDGLTYRPATLPRKYIQPGAHNVGISGDELGRFNPSQNNVVAYAYGTRWAYWYTAMQPFALTNDALPTTPRITAAVAGDSSVTLHYQTTGVPGETYTIRYGTTSGTYTTTIAGVTSSPYTVTGLVNGTRYFFSVVAVGAGGTSPNSPQQAAVPRPFTPTPRVATASSAIAGWPTAAVTDGNPDTTWSSNGTTNQDTTEWVQVDTGASHLIGRVSLTPRQSGEHGYPKTLHIHISEDGSNWAAADTIATRLDSPHSKYVYELTRPLRGRYVHLTATSLGENAWSYPQYYYFQLGEIEVEQVAGGASASSEFPNWAATKVLDGVSNSVWSSGPIPTDTGTEWIRLDLGAPANVTGVVLTPRPSGMCFPRDFVIQSSVDGTNYWTTIPGQSYVGYAGAGSNPIRFGFAASVEARYLRVQVTRFNADSNGNYFAQLAEFAAETAPIRNPSAFSEISWLPPSNATDNKPGSVYSSDSRAVAVPASPEWIAVDMGAVASWSGINLTPRGLGGGNDPYGFPVDFAVQSSTDGVTWTALSGHEYVNYYDPGTTEQHFPFVAPVNARYFRIHATKLRADSGGLYHLQIGEFNVYP